MRTHALKLYLPILWNQESSDYVHSMKTKCHPKSPLGLLKSENFCCIIYFHLVLFSHRDVLGPGLRPPAALWCQGKLLKSLSFLICKVEICGANVCTDSTPAQVLACAQPTATIFSLHFPENIQGNTESWWCLMRFLRDPQRFCLNCEEDKAPFKGRGWSPAEGLLLLYMPAGELTVASDSVLWVFCDVQGRRQLWRSQMGNEAVSWQGHLTLPGSPSSEKHPSARALDRPGTEAEDASDHFPSFPCSYEAVTKFPAKSWLQARAK